MLAIVLGLVFVSGAGWIFHRDRQLSRRGQCVTGTVVDFRSGQTVGSSDGPASTVYYPILAFRTVDGGYIQTEAALGSSRLPARLGEQVPVIYDPDNPERASINTPAGRGRWMPAIMVLLGLAILVWGVYGLR
jgi:hypothetical protein